MGVSMLGCRFSKSNLTHVTLPRRTNQSNGHSEQTNSTDLSHKYTSRTVFMNVIGNIKHTASESQSLGMQDSINPEERDQKQKIGGVKPKARGGKEIRWCIKE